MEAHRNRTDSDVLQIYHKIQIFFQKLQCTQILMNQILIIILIIDKLLFVFQT